MAEPSFEDGAVMLEIGADAAQDSSALSDGPEDARVSEWTRRRALLLVFVVLICIGGGVGTTVLAVSWKHSEDAIQSRREALEVGKQLAVDMVSLNYTSFDADVASIKERTTGQLTEQIEQSQEAQGKLDRELKIERVASVTGAGVLRLDGDTARVIVALDSTVTRAAAKPQELGYRIQLELKRTSDGWKASIVEFVP
jgi:Mce-associated membrane protein